MLQEKVNVLFAYLGVQITAVDDACEAARFLAEREDLPVHFVGGPSFVHKGPANFWSKDCSACLLSSSRRFQPEE